VSNDFPWPFLKICQAGSFEEEICLVRKGKQLPSTPNILNPEPALNSGGILWADDRVGRVQLTFYQLHLLYCHLKKKRFYRVGSPCVSFKFEKCWNGYPASIRARGAPTYLDHQRSRTGERKAS
jgi:hypothetical protein